MTIKDDDSFLNHKDWYEITENGDIIYTSLAPREEIEKFEMEQRMINKNNLGINNFEELLNSEEEATEMENEGSNNIELTTQHKTEEENVDKVEKKEEEFPEDAKKIFGLK